MAIILAMLANAATVFTFVLGPIRGVVGWVLFRPQDPRRLLRKKALSHADVDRAISELAPDVDAYGPDVIAGVAAGGAIVAGLLAKKLKEVREAVPIVVLERREGTSGPDYEVTADVAGKRVVLVDDVFATGQSMTAARQRLQQNGAAHIKMAVILLEGKERPTGSAATAGDVRPVYRTDRLNVKLPWDLEPLAKQ